MSDSSPNVSKRRRITICGLIISFVDIVGFAIWLITLLGILAWTVITTSPEAIITLLTFVGGTIAYIRNRLRSSTKSAPANPVLPVLPDQPTSIIKPPAEKAPAPPRKLTGRFPQNERELPIIGREADLSKVKLLMGNNRVVFITGMGGVGKTRLTVALIDQTAADFTDGTAYLRIENYTKLDTLVGLLRDHLSLQPTDPDHVIQDKIATMHMLIVLDNAEECPSDERGKIADWLNTLDTNGGTRIVITGRENEWENFKLAPSHRLEAPKPPDAVTILRNMATQRGIADKIAGQESTLAAAARNHPRLLWYSIGWLVAYPVEEVLAILKDLKGKDAEEALDDMVQRTLRRMAREDGEENRVALRKLAVCRGGFTTEAAKALIGAELHPLRVLMKWNLAAKNDKDRYALEPLALTAVEPEAEDYRPHYVYYEYLAWDHNIEQDYAGLDIESDNLTAAFEWALKTGDGKDALNLVNACGQLLLNRGQVRLLVDWCERTAAKLEAHPDKALWGNIQNSLGFAYDLLAALEEHAANLNRAIIAYKESLVYRPARSGAYIYANTQCNLGIVYEDSGDLKAAADCWREAEIYYRQMGYIEKANEMLEWIAAAEGG